MQTNLIQARRLALATACSLMLSVAGCSSIPKPVAELASAETAISGAESSDAIKYAPADLERAKTKLQAAKSAVNDENYAEATRYAQEALADGNLAKTKADAIKTKKAAAEMEESINLLRKALKLDTPPNQ